MDDRFLHEMRRDPDPKFADGLRDKLRRQNSPVARLTGWPRLHPALAGALAVVLIAVSFSFPAVRASAQAFLDLFRVRNFAAVTVDAARIKQLEDGKLDLKALLGQHVQTLQEPGPAVLFPTAQAASASAGFAVRVPSTLPNGLTADSVAVQGAGAVRGTVDAQKLRHVMEALDIRDVAVPMQLDGQSFTLRMPPVVAQKFRHERFEMHLMQARSPQIELPPGVDLAQIGEIGLRIVGLDPAEARRFAHTIDWRTTMLVPVPSNAGSFSQVDVNGNRGLLVTTEGNDGGDSGRRHRPANLLLWSEGEMVYALGGNLNRMDLLQMANSIQ